jgi:hypothetical protein
MSGYVMAFVLGLVFLMIVPRAGFKKLLLKNQL